MNHKRKTENEKLRTFIKNGLYVVFMFAFFSLINFIRLTKLVNGQLEKNKT